VASRMIMFRASEEFIEACSEAAKSGGLNLSAWLRRLVEKEIGVSAKLPQGMAALTDAQQREIIGRSIAARKKKAAKRKEQGVDTSRTRKRQPGRHRDDHRPV
jgi:hypothetical protein